MEAIYEWVRSIVSYLIFITVLLQLLPSSRYEKYLRLFAGCILILLVMEPVTKGLRLQQRLDAVFQAISFENEVGELKGQIDAMEQKRLSCLLDEYERSAEEEVERLAMEHGFLAGSVEVSMERDEDSENFGKIKAISMQVQGRQPGSQPAAAEQAGTGQERKENVKPVEIERIGAVEIDGEGEAAEEAAGRALTAEPEKQILEGAVAERPERQTSEGAVAEQPERRPSEGTVEARPERQSSEGIEAAELTDTSVIHELRREIAGYYRVEEAYVEIEVEP